MRKFSDLFEFRNLWICRDANALADLLVRNTSKVKCIYGSFSSAPRERDYRPSG